MAVRCWAGWDISMEQQSKLVVDVDSQPRSLKGQKRLAREKRRGGNPGVFVRYGPGRQEAGEALCKPICCVTKGRRTRGGWPGRRWAG